MTGAVPKGPFTGRSATPKPNVSLMLKAGVSLMLSPGIALALSIGPNLSFDGRTASA